MRRIIGFAISVLYSLIKLSIIKLLNWNGLTFYPIERISPNVVTEFSHGSVSTLGHLVKIRSGTKIQVRKGGLLKIGDDVKINYNCIVSCHGRIEIGKGTEFGPSVYVYDHDHNYRDGLENNLFNTSSVIIGENCWIGANTVILRGTSLGNRCVVGAGSVLKGNYPDGALIIQKRETTYKIC